MGKERTSLVLLAAMAALLMQTLVTPVMSSRATILCNTCSPDPSVGSPPSGSHSPPSHGSGGSHGTPSHSSGSHGGTPSHGSGSHGGSPPANCGNPPSGGSHHHTPTPSTPSTPTPSTPTPSTPTPTTPSTPTDPGTTPSTPGGGGYYGGSPPSVPTPSTPDITPAPPTPTIDPGTTPSTPGGGSYGGIPPSIPTPSTPDITPIPPTPTIDPGTPSTPGGGGYYGGSPPSIPTPSTPDITPTPLTPITGTPPITPIIDPGTPSAPGVFPIDPNSPPFSCDYWRTHPALIWGLFGWWGNVGNAFGAPTAIPSTVPGFGSSMNLLQALSNTRGDGLGELYRQGTASLLNSMVSNRFTYSTNQVRDSFVSALGSDRSAAAQAQLFKLANEGRA